ncbi:MAG: WD40 repeat domain-containing protein [Chloroflexi bacterium]|nr:WD40 repeat domain-containing protein [Chloroflexota bacterium]
MHEDFYTPERIDEQIDALLQGRSLSPRDQHLADDLRAILEQGNENERSLQKVLQKLLSDASTQPTEKIIALTDRQLPGRSAVMQSGTYSQQPHKAQPLLRAWSMLAAILLLAVLVGSMLLILNIVRQQHAGTLPVIPASTATTPVPRTPTPPEGQIIYKSGQLSFSSPVVWSPDGTRVAAVIKPGTVESWDALTGQNVLKYQPGEGIAATPVGTNTVAWSPDGSTLAVATTSGVSLFNARTAQLMRTLSPPQALGEQTSSLTATSGLALSNLLPHSGSGGIFFDDIAWSPDGKEVSTFTSNGVYIFDAQNGSLVTHLSNVFLINNVNSVRELWQPHGHLLATIECQDAACQTTQVSLWDTTTWSVVKQYPDIYTLDWSPDGSQLALVGAARTKVLIVDALTGQQIKQITDPRIHTITAIHWSSDGSRLAMGTLANNTVSLSIWSIASGKQLYVFPHNDCSEARWSPDGRYLSCIQYEKAGIRYFQQILIWAA